MGGYGIRPYGENVYLIVGDFIVGDGILDVPYAKNI
jgi:hypothetical protein